MTSPGDEHGSHTDVAIIGSVWPGFTFDYWRRTRRPQADDFVAAR